MTLSQVATPAATGAGTVLTVITGAGNSVANEKQTVTLGANSTGGTFTLSFATTSPTASAATPAIAYNAPATDPGTPGVIDSVQEALESLPNIGAGNVSVTGTGGAAGVYTITFRALDSLTPMSIR